MAVLPKGPRQMRALRRVPGVPLGALSYVKGRAPLPRRGPIIYSYTFFFNRMTRRCSPALSSAYSRSGCPEAAHMRAYIRPLMSTRRGVMRPSSLTTLMGIKTWWLSTVPTVLRWWVCVRGALWGA